MASKPMIYAKVNMTQNHIDRFRAEVKRNGLRGLDRAGREGAAIAKAKMTRVRSGKSKASIRWIRAPGTDNGMIIVGTLAGAVQEFGSKARKSRGKVTPLNFLRAGFAHTMNVVVGRMKT